ncbi:hypothetical protein ACH5RR_007285 [Cinchona calisaya]|uniref:Secreted protein n=1 Tax=Cinchona calisaya TaxID=153742 RepID=A0ABD3ARU0_9GENT
MMDGIAALDLLEKAVTLTLLVYWACCWVDAINSIATLSLYPGGHCHCDLDYWVVVVVEGNMVVAYAHREVYSPKPWPSSFIVSHS